MRQVIHINIAITMKENNFSMVIENDKEDAPQRINGHHPGKGIANVKRQLELLYGKQYSLELEDAPKRYRVSLLVPAKRIEEYA